MKPTRINLEEHVEELRDSMAECRSNIRLQESFIKEDLKALQDAQITYNRRLNAIAEEKQMYSTLDYDLALVDGRLKEYTTGGKIKRPSSTRKTTPAMTTDELVAILKGLDLSKLAVLRNKLVKADWS